MPKYSHYLIIIVLLLIPLYPKFPLVGVSGTFVAVRLEDLVVAACFAIYGLYLLRNRFSPLSNPIPRAILLYWFIGFIASFSGIFLTKTSSLSLGFLHALRRVEYMSLFFIGFEYLKTKDQLHTVIKVLLVISFLVAFYGVGQQVFGFPVISTNNSEFSKGLALQLGPGARINSTFAGHYDLAAFSAFPLLLILALLPISKYKSVLLGIWGLVYWSLLMSASRVTFVSFFASAALLLILIHKKLWIVPLGILAIIGVLISPQLRGRYLEFIKNSIKISYISSVRAQSATEAAESKAVDTIPDALKEPIVAEDRSFNIRLRVEWPRALRSIVKNPILGTGYSSVGLAVDNEYLRILAETGILGLLAFALIVIRLFKSSTPVIINYQPSVSSAFVLSVTCFLVSLLFGGVFIDVFAASKIALFTWTLLGLAQKTLFLKT